MLKKLLNFIKVNKDDKQTKEEVKDVKIEVEKIKPQENLQQDESDIADDIDENQVENEYDQDEIEEKTTIEDEKSCELINEEDEKFNELTDEEKEYIKLAKIQRGKKIKAIDVYSNEEFTFETHKECSKKLGVPIEYIKENLQYGYTDYFGEAIKFLSKKLKVDISPKKIGNKNIIEVFNLLHEELWNKEISEEKREEILSSNNIDAIHMHYKFEDLDKEYDEYFKKYGKIIRRGGKKRIELIDKKQEVIEVFKSIDDCAKFFDKNKSEITNRLKLGECKIGRYEIKYSLRR
ncbi:hypothetical protein [Paraclostridium bifermentans]|uniref:hypothetical protein n=1 Tax=Paraclostridium bifermentans TaxID=1490 RepID=UPI00359CA5C7